VKKAAKEAASQTGEQIGASTVVMLEYARGIEERVILLEHLRGRSFGGRLRWLLTGR
jgi:hypothetical protein